MLLLANHKEQPQETTVSTLIANHPVTLQMDQETKSWTQKLAPTFTTADTNGKQVWIGNLGKPQFVYFVLDGCPCSMNAEPLFQKLWKHHNKQIEFTAVTNADIPAAKVWAKQMIMPYALVPDPKLKIIRAFKATNSVFSVLLAPDGHIVKMWPGYSQGILREMNSEMAKLLGTPAKPFDVAYAPKERASGCAFSL